MRTEELDYPLDPALIATAPATPRDEARLMVLDRQRRAIEHHRVRDLPRLLLPTDHLVVNETSVLRARLVFEATTTTPRTEGLLLEPSAHQGAWRLLVRQAKRFKSGQRLALRDPHGVDHGDSVELLQRDEEAWIGLIHAGNAGGDLTTILERSGHTPLPPYILKARKDRGQEVDDDLDRAEYETVYATQKGSIAAPTAGLHFTAELLNELQARGISRTTVTLHVGAGTFKPVEVDDLRHHTMHRESYAVSREALQTLATLAEPRQHGSARTVVVGTTTVRALESLPLDAVTRGESFEGSTDILISPGFSFRFTDVLLTNFHLPRSTLLALVGAFAGMEFMHEAYRSARREKYRFYSYGDAMLIV